MERPPDAPVNLVGRTTAGVFLAVVGTLLTTLVAETAGVNVGPTGPTSPFGTVPVVASVILAGVGAAVVYAVLATRTATPGRAFLLASVVVLAVSFVPILVVAPSLGVTPAGQVVLGVYHVTVATALVAGVLGYLTS